MVDEPNVVQLRTGDAALCAALRRGDPEAGDELVRRYGPDVRRVAASILGPSSELLDVVHEALIRVLSKVSTLRDPSKLRSWLVGVTVRVAREHLRRIQRFPASLPPESLVRAGPESDHDARGELRRVFAILERLPPDERVAFALRHLEGMKLKEVADATGASLATVKRRIRRAAEAFERAAREDPLLRDRLEGST